MSSLTSRQKFLIVTLALACASTSVLAHLQMWSAATIPTMIALLVLGLMSLQTQLRISQASSRSGASHREFRNSLRRHGRAVMEYQASIPRFEAALANQTEARAEHNQRLSEGFGSLRTDLAKVYSLLRRKTNKSDLAEVAAELSQLHRSTIAAHTTLEHTVKDRSSSQRDALNLNKSVKATERRLENTERRILGTLETERLTRLAADQEIGRLSSALQEGLSSLNENDMKRFTELRASIAEIAAANDMSNNSELLAALKKHSDRLANRIDSASRNEVTQIESLMQATDLLQQAAAPLPPSGGWALDARSLVLLSHLIRERRPRVVVELGSGTSTTWLGYACADAESRLVSLDHDAHYGGITNKSIEEHHLPASIECRLSPLTATGLAGHSTPWYDVSSLDDIDSIDLLIVDGPPKATGEKSRYPAVPLLLSKLSPGAMVILDDANRPDEEAMLLEWESMDPSFRRVDLGIPRLGVLERV